VLERKLTWEQEKEKRTRENIWWDLVEPQQGAHDKNKPTTAIPEIERCEKRWCRNNAGAKGKAIQKLPTQGRKE